MSIITVVCHRVYTGAVRPFVRRSWRPVGRIVHHVARPLVLGSTIACVAVPGALWALLPPPPALIPPSLIPPLAAPPPDIAGIPGIAPLPPGSVLWYVPPDRAETGVLPGPQEASIVGPMPAPAWISPSEIPTRRLVRETAIPPPPVETFILPNQIVVAEPSTIVVLAIGVGLIVLIRRIPSRMDRNKHGQ